MDDRCLILSSFTASSISHRGLAEWKSRMRYIIKPMRYEPPEAILWAFFLGARNESLYRTCEVVLVMVLDGLGGRGTPVREGR